MFSLLICVPFKLVYRHSLIKCYWYVWALAWYRIRKWNQLLYNNTTGEIVTCFFSKFDTGNEINRKKKMYHKSLDCYSHKITYSTIVNWIKIMYHSIIPKCNNTLYTENAISDIINFYNITFTDFLLQLFVNVQSVFVKLNNMLQINTNQLSMLLHAL